MLSMYLPDDLWMAGEWLAFCEHVGLIDDNQMSVFGCKMAFLWYGLIPQMSP